MTKLATIAMSTQIALSAVFAAMPVAVTSAATVAANGDVGMTASTFTAAQSDGSVTISVQRDGGKSGAASVKYTTLAESAEAGQQFTAQSGTLTWANNDAAVKTFKIPLNTSPVFSGTKSFVIRLTAGSGTLLGAHSAATVNVVGGSGSGSGGGGGTTDPVTKGVPAPASEHGYNTVTFDGNFTAKTVDMSKNLNKGYKWYLTGLFGYEADPAGIKLNSDGSVTLLGDNTGAAGELSSIGTYRGTNSFVGTAFGGGFYIEAVYNFNYSQVAAQHPAGSHKAMPSFWSLPLESISVYGTNQWPGQAKGYLHNVEFDFFEADYYGAKNGYGMGMHDWWGIPNDTCGKGMCGLGFLNPSGERLVPAGTNWTAYHTYGTLWVPATATSKGMTSAYFDGKLVGATREWSQYTNQAPTPTGKSWAFGRVDQQHMFFILGTGTGEPMNIKSVTVYQKNASGNIVH